MKLWRKRVYADAAGATPLSSRARAELIRLLELSGNPSALHKEGAEAKRELDHARESVAQTIGAHADEIIFTSGGTEANNLAIFGSLRRALREGEKVHAITSAIEHSSVLEPLRALAKEGIELTELSVDAEGVVNRRELRDAITPHTKLVSIQMINSEIGTIQNIKELAREIRHARSERAPNAARESSKILFHTDASQAPLWLAIRVEKLGVDMLTLDAQKIMGPKGVGLLFVRRGIELTPLIYGGGQERGSRSGTENVPLIGALAVALKEAQEKAIERSEHTFNVRSIALNEIKTRIPDAHVNGPIGEMRAPYNLHISIPDLDGDMAVIALDREGVAASTRSACDSNAEAPSHVLEAIRAPYPKNSIRITFLPEATEKDALDLAKNLEEITRRYRRRKS
ncbi:MAG TPA: cysteine desulfurase family protein [Candidatus Paceibacterota bacterium]|nr:cysteine desulfurase family protein [Candidatus Paceibacterota bacterium]